MDTQTKVAGLQIKIDNYCREDHPARLTTVCVPRSCATKIHTLRAANFCCHHFENYNWVTMMAREGTESNELSGVSFMQVAGHC